MSDPARTPPPPPPPPAGFSPAPAAPAPDRRTPWDGRDLLIILLTGGGLGLVLTVGVFVPFLVASAEPRPSAQLAIVSLTLYGSLCFFGYWFAIKRHSASLGDAGFMWKGIGPMLLMIPAAIALMTVNFFIVALVSTFGDVPTAQEQVLGDEGGLAAIDLVLLLLAGAVVAPFAEEFLFRGLLYRYLRSRRGIPFATILSSVVFAIAHFVWILIPSYIVFGIAEALVVERYKSLYPAIALHALNNATLFVVLFLSQSV